MIVRPVRLSTRPKSANRTNSGITAVTMGRDCTTNNTNENPETNWLLPRDNTYPAGAATATDTTTVTTVTSMLFFSHVKTSVCLKIRTKFSSVKLAVVSLPSEGRRASMTTAMIGTSTTPVITNMAKNRHQVPRASGSTFLRAAGATGGPTAVGFCEMAAVIVSAPS